jgi:hypothetical protein
MPLPTLYLARDNGIGEGVASLAVDVLRICGIRSSIGLALALPVEINTFGRATILQISGSFGFPNESTGLEIPTQPLVFNSEYLSIPISESQLARIERVRSGKPLVLEARIRAIALINDVPHVVVAQNPLTLPVPLEKWLEVLETLNQGRRRLIELPAIQNPVDPSWASASEQLEKASWRLAAGDSGGSMSETRSALERVVEAVGLAVGRPRTPTDTAMKNYVEAVIAAAKARHTPRSADPYRVLESCLQLTIAVFQYSSDVAHQGLDAADRVSADLALSLTAALYSYATRLPSLQNELES